LLGATGAIAAGPASAAETVGNFSYGQLGSSTVGATGCGTNIAGEPAIHVSRADNVFLGSENGLGGGSELWRGLGALGGSGVPVDDREWIAAFGAETSLLSYHEVASNNIEVLRSDDGGQVYTRVATAIPVGDYREASNELGNLVIDHRNLPDQTGDFYAYQS